MTTLLSAYPDLRPYTLEELKGMSAEQIQGLLNKVTAAGRQISTSVIQLQTQATALEQQLTEQIAEAQKQYGVTNVDELDALRLQELEKLAAIYATIGNLTNPQPQA